MKNWSIIVAIGNNNEIGKDNDLLWRISADLKRFKTITTGNTIVMGRKTFESLPKGALPNRRNIVLSKQNLEYENTEVYSTVEQVVEATKDDKDVFVIGGASVYELFISKVNKMYLTQVNEDFDADVFFPEFDWSEWSVLEKDYVDKGEKNQFAHTFYILNRI